MHALLNYHDCLEPSIPIFEGDYVIANTDEFGLVKGERYKVLEINALDLITVRMSEKESCEFTVEYFNQVKKGE